MTYRVQLTAQAEADIDRIFDWLFQRSPEGPGLVRRIILPE